MGNHGHRSPSQIEANRNKPKSPEAKKRQRKAYRKKHGDPDDYFVGLDGEGQGREDHRYVMLAWSDAEGKNQDHIIAEKGKGLSSMECLEFLLGMPNRARAFAFAFNYDLTMMLRDLPPRTLYRLSRPELRQRKPGYEKFGPKPERWKCYSLNLIGTKFTVKAGKRTRVIWDVFKFFQTKFVTALIDWKIGEIAKLERMRDMKDRRADFDKLDTKEILDYCFEECRYMASLAKKLTVSHEEAGLTLKSYFGAGSSASAMLKLMGIGDLPRTGPPEIEEAVACAFAGGRFENSVLGAVSGPVWSYDISSAYPYELYFMPCLGCGKWEKTRSRKKLEKARAAIVRYTLGKAPRNAVWGPFPFRTEHGAIAFPAESGGGWVYLQEYLAGEKLFPNVEFKEAWIYKCDCNHRPFDMMPRFYEERLKLGKEGPGIVIKLGSNSCYGKLAQSVGLNPPFRSPIWAGMITSGTRAKIISDAMGSHKNLSNLLMIATDGIYTRERLMMPTPRDTGTFEARDITTGKLKPLGGWEEKKVDKGVFCARPGIYFPLDPTEDEVQQIRARGVGRSIMFKNCAKVVRAWRSGEMTVKLPNVTRFRGMKSSIYAVKSASTGKLEYVLADRYSETTGRPTGGVVYGQWETRKIVMSFAPMPKREAIRKDGSLRIRRFPKTEVSAPYDRMRVSDDALTMKLATIEAMEQPAGDDLTDYETDR